jgi:hypothetical protein
MRTALALLLTLAPATAQTTWYVDVNGVAPGTGTPSDPYTSIQYAITRPSTNYFDTLLVAPGTYVENIVATNELLRIRSTHGPLHTTLRAFTTGPIAKLDSFTSLDGFTITGFIPGGGGLNFGVVHLLDATLQNSIVRDNAGRALFAQYQANIENCTLVNNTSLIWVDTFTGMAWMGECITDAPLPIVGGNAELHANYTIANFGVTPTTPLEQGDTPDSFGVGNLDVDPQLWDENGGDMKLRPGSPAIDAGNPASPLDPDGSPRDIGAVPYDAGYLPAPLVYCTSQTNSLGCAPSIGSSGIASATSASPCFVTCSNQINQRAGFLFYGYAPRSHPYQGGFLCVQSPTRRTTPQNSGGSSSGLDCAGTFSYELNALIQSGVDPALAPGTFVYGQYWSRDPAAASTANRSDAVRLAIAP